MNLALRSLPLLLIVMATTGCQTFSPDWSLGKSWNKLWNPDPKEIKTQFQTPARLVALWAPAMYNTPGKPATRGFGGRLYFYNHKDEPIPIEGQMVVYAYNDSAQQVDGRKPDRKFVFTSAQLSTHFSPAELGASYSIWIPWDAVGGQQLEISLLPVFTASSGQVIVGEQSRNLLPGTTAPTPNAQIQQSQVQPIIIDHRVAPASFQSPTDLGVQPQQMPGVSGQQSFFTHATQPAPSENIRTTSIQLTRGIAERLGQERRQEAAAQPAGSPPGLLPGANLPPTTTYPLPAGSMPANMTGQPVPGNLQPNAQSSFNVPTGDSRSWGPTVQRTHAPVPQSTIGQSPTRYAPGSLPVPAKAGLQPASGQQLSLPGPAAPQHLPPSSPQSNLYPSTQASWQTGSANGY
ncbi:hypothetical protein ETAA8_12290 [Anatilimnocola aggregata]|uniref:Uncharacterized protein n=1 Tax=Anatilimnocola aggregata TaxID=2528021 RepID=A0A517Y7I3_9BACT|nr:hypothetical protein [Anatilimnocola aggregata]QDU26155.1 hypothetical protein ETAA8_12290 [Anatilimnocola aggregata]